jgi:RNA polymerase II subunit A small phosphatase-like protein
MLLNRIIISKTAFGHRIYSALSEDARLFALEFRICHWAFVFFRGKKINGITQFLMVPALQDVPRSVTLGSHSHSGQLELHRGGSNPVLPRLSVIFDLDETLIHGSLEPPETYDFAVSVQYGGTPTTIYIQERPGVREFIRFAAMEFDIFIFTASLAEYAIPVVQHLLSCFPPERILSRIHCRCVNGLIVKDLSIFKRDLSRMIIVDNTPQSFMLQPGNGIEISTWVGDQSDLTLLDQLLPFLRLCASVNDVRPLLAQAQH